MQPMRQERFVHAVERAELQRAARRMGRQAALALVGVAVAGVRIGMSFSAAGSIVFRALSTGSIMVAHAAFHA